MAYTSNKPLKRHGKIQDIVAQRKTVTFAELSEMLHCSESTIRSDLKYLEGQGLLRRTLGGAVALERTPFLSLNTRLSINREEKRIIAEYAVKKFIKPGSVVMLDGSSTNHMICEELIKTRRPITAVTNSLSNAELLSKSDNISLYLAGGHFNPAHSTFYDYTAEYVIRTMRADYFFLSINGLHPNYGATLNGTMEVHIKHLMMECSEKTILCADNSKIGNTCFKVVSGVEGISTLVTDSKSDPDTLAKLEKLGTEILIADPNYNDEMYYFENGRTMESPAPAESLEENK